MGLKGTYLVNTIQLFNAFIGDSDSGVDGFPQLRMGLWL